MIFWGAFILGLMGNIHCLGMCGPIALAVPVKNHDKKSRLLSALTYNAGRILIYTLFGALFGLFGEGLKLAGAQQQISMILGIIIILSLIFPIMFKKLNVLNKPIFKFTHTLKSAFHSQFSRKTFKSIFTIGLLNGFLPCGLVYMAVAGSIASGSVLNGMAFMALFGVGTLPIMVALPYYGQLIKEPVKKKFRKLVPVFIFLFGTLFILRGANLNIPLLSPDMKTESVQNVKCH